MTLQTVRQTLLQAENKLRQLPHSEPRLEAELLLCHTLGKNRSYLFAWPEQNLEPTQLEDFQQRLSRRLSGEPIAYILGRREFWSLSLKVTPDTLIPRPETELLVEQALHHIPEDQSCQVADLGTGSGAIALAIASERPKAEITATDRSKSALSVAEENRQNHRLANVTCSAGDWCNALATDHRYDLIVSNPPYIAERDPHLLRGDLPHEPVTALSSGRDGLNDIRIIVRQAKEHLQPGGWLLLEHGYNQGEGIRKILHQENYINTKTVNDLASIDRITEGQIPHG